jgi:hypothetical protein
MAAKSGMRTTRLGTYLLTTCIAGLFSAAVAQAADTVAPSSDLIVVSTTNTSFHEGDSLPISKQVTLAAGQSLTLASQDGTITTLNGPFNGMPNKPGEAKTASVADVFTPLLRQVQTEAAVPGAVRNGEATAGPQLDPWVIDSSNSGTVCIHQAVEYDMWRPNGTQPASFTLAPVGGGDGVTLKFDAKVTRVGMPDTFTFKDNAQYTITGPDGTKTITVRTIPESVPTSTKVTAIFFKHDNCQQQAEAMVRWLTN